MNTKIPPMSSAQVFTRHSFEAGFLYALGEVQPGVHTDGTYYVFRQQDDNGKPVCWFCFQHGARSEQIHRAFLDNSYEDSTEHEIPEEVMPAVIALMKRTWHNYQRCRDAAFDDSLPLHSIKTEGRKTRIKVVTP
jgi:hypothetical protein